MRLPKILPQPGTAWYSLFAVQSFGGKAVQLLKQRP